MFNTDPCGVYGQVTHSNPDMDSVEDLEAEFMSASHFVFFCFLFAFFFASEKKYLQRNRYEKEDLQPTISQLYRTFYFVSVLTFTDITTSIAMVINAIWIRIKALAVFFYL